MCVSDQWKTLQTTWPVGVKILGVFLFRFAWRLFARFFVLQLGSILKLQVCNFAEIKRSYENSTAKLSIGRSSDPPQLRSIFNLCFTFVSEIRAERGSSRSRSGRPGNGASQLAPQLQPQPLFSVLCYRPYRAHCAHTKCHSVHVATQGIPISRRHSMAFAGKAQSSSLSGLAGWQLVIIISALPTSQII